MHDSQINLHSCSTRRLTPLPQMSDFRILIRFLRRYVYFRVISIDFLLYACPCHCMIIGLLHTHTETIAGISLTHYWIFDSSRLQCYPPMPVLMTDHLSFSVTHQRKFVVLTQLRHLTSIVSTAWSSLLR